MKVYCDVCATFIPSAALVEGHNKGKKHQRLLEVQLEKEKSGQRSVYVRNFDTSGTIEEDLKHHFSRYGDVRNVFLDKEQGVYAIVEFEERESVAKVLDEQDPPPLKGKKLRVKARTVPKGKKHEHGTSSHSSPAGRQSHPHGEMELAPFLEEKIITKLRSKCLVSEQVDILVKELGLTADDLKLRWLVCDLLQEVFKEAYPKVKVVPFGSTMTGLGWKGCDLDLSLVTESSLSSGTSKAASVDVSKPVDKQEGSEQDYSLVIDVLRNLAPGCVHVIPVLSAKCPLIKFTHQPSGLACDLSINNRLGICNSELLKCYMSLDPRVIQLVFAVRAWAKAKCVSEKGLLSNYALTLMVLYFLQMTTPPIIPSLQDPAKWLRLESTNQSAANVNQGTADENYVTGGMIDGWNCTYLSNVTSLSPSKNIKTLDHLLEEFFNFYGSEFDYGNNVINIRSGKRTTLNQALEELDLLAKRDRLSSVSQKEMQESNSAADKVGRKSVDGDTTWQGRQISPQLQVESASDDCDIVNDDATWQGRQISAQLKVESATDDCDIVNADRAVGDCNCSLTIEAEGSPPTTAAKKSEFKVTPLCIQDPFELTHNVAQNISATTLKQLIQHMMNGRVMCKNFMTQGNSKGSLLKLLSASRRKKKKERKKSPGYTFFVPFHSHKKDGDECSGGAHSTESIFYCVLKILQDTFGVVCEVTDEGKPAVQGRNMECAKVPCKVLGHQDKEEVICHSENRLASHPDPGEVGNCDGSPSTMETGICGVKRKAMAQSESTTGNSAKKLKYCDDERAGDKYEANCTAQKNTWKSHRREKRHQKTETLLPGEKSGQKEVGNGTPPTSKETVDLRSKSFSDDCSSNIDSHPCESLSPVIVFKLSVSGCKQQTSGCNILIEGVVTADPQVLGNFFGVFKKLVTSHLV